MWDPVSTVAFTSKGDRGVFVEGHQWGVQQNGVHVLSDDTVVGRLDPRLVFVHCGDGEREDRASVRPLKANDSNTNK